MKNLILLLALFTLFPLEARDEKDWTLDLKTSTLIPKYAGKVKEIRGEAMIEDRTLSKDSKIYPNDTVKTDDKSFVKLELIDDTIITIGPKTEFYVESWSYRTKNDRDSMLSLLKGRIRVEIKSKAKSNGQLKYKSPLVAMGVRGTTFMLNNTFIKNKEITQVALIEGNIYLEPKEGKNKINLKPGDYIEIIKGAQDTKQNMKVLPTAEFDQLKMPEAPEEFRLMDEIVLNDQTELPGTQNDPAMGANAKEATFRTDSQVKKAESLKEKIKILNTIREENRKK